jgi:hypothetical protein
LRVGWADLSCRWHSVVHMTDDQPMTNLLATQQLPRRLAEHPDRALVDALVEGFGNLESLRRNQPTDHPIIDTRKIEPLKETPITQMVVNMLENAMRTYEVRSDAATALASASIIAFKALELRIRIIEDVLGRG